MRNRKSQTEIINENYHEWMIDEMCENMENRKWDRKKKINKMKESEKKNVN